jgi:hypothetical protein
MVSLIAFHATGDVLLQTNLAHQPRIGKVRVAGGIGPVADAIQAQGGVVTAVVVNRVPVFTPRPAFCLVTSRLRVRFCGFAPARSHNRRPRIRVHWSRRRGIRGSAFTHISRFVFSASLCGCVHFRHSPVRHSFSGGGASFCGPSPPGPPEKTVIESIESTESLITYSHRPKFALAGRAAGGGRLDNAKRPPVAARCAPRRGEQPVQGHRKERRPHDLGTPTFMAPAASPFAFFAFLCGCVRLCQSASICGPPAFLVRHSFSGGGCLLPFAFCPAMSPSGLS